MLVFKGKNNLKPGESEKRDFSVQKRNGTENKNITVMKMIQKEKINKHDRKCNFSY